MLRIDQMFTNGFNTNKKVQERSVFVCICSAVKVTRGRKTITLFKTYSKEKSNSKDHA